MSFSGTQAPAPGWRDRLQALRAGQSHRRMRRARPLDVPLEGDAARARALLAGRFTLARSRIEMTAGTSIWAVACPDGAAEAARQDFGWLDDLAALGTGSARACARTWVIEWLTRQGRGHGPGWTLPSVAARLPRLLSHAGWLVEGPDGIRMTRLERAFARHHAFALRRIGALPEGPAGVSVASRLVIASCGLDGADRLLGAAQAALERLAGSLIAQDGGVESRSPDMLAGLFCDLAEAAGALRAADHAPGPEHARALARAAPCLRALRHAGGGLARFHGGGAGPGARLDAGFAAASPDASVRGAPPLLPMGYARLARGPSTLIVDAAAPPGGAAAPHAHASTLAFEMSAGRHPLVVNCGAGTAFGPDWRAAARGTASHSTLVLDGAPSAPLSDRPLGAGPAAGDLPDVEVDLFPDLPAARLVAAHNGYAEAYGLIHVRRLDLSLDGTSLRGEDLLSAVTAAEKRHFAQVRPAQGVPFTVRFHLHPDCDAKLDPVREEVAIRQPDGALWWFRHTSACTIRLDPSIYLENTHAEPVPTQQIVLHGYAVQYATPVGWSLTCDAGSPAIHSDVAREEAGKDDSHEVT